MFDAAVNVDYSSPSRLVFMEMPAASTDVQNTAVMQGGLREKRGAVYDFQSNFNFVLVLFIHVCRYILRLAMTEGNIRPHRCHTSIALYCNRGGELLLPVLSI